MNQTIETLSHRQLHFFNDLPPNFTGIRLPGGQVISASAEFGEVCIQEFNGGKFIMRYSVITTKEESLTLKLQSHHSGLHFLIMLRNHISLSFENVSDIRIRESQFIIYNGQQPLAVIPFLENRQYIIFEIMLTKELSDHILQDFPSLQNSMNKKVSRVPDIWVNPAKRFDDVVENHIRYVLGFTERDEWRRNFFENQVWDIAWQLLALHVEGKQEEIIITDKEINAAQIVAEYIVKNLQEHALITKLAQKASVNATFLKKAFKKVYGMGIHEYRIYHRLIAAIEFLNDGNTVNEAAAKVGWRSADFIEAYKKVYNSTPGTIRQKKK